MLGLEIFLTPRSLKTVPLADAYLQEICDTCAPLNWKYPKGWMICSEEVGIWPRWNRHWRIWIANYPYGWLKEIAYTDWGILTEENFHRVPWVTVVKNKMPTRKASFKFWWWLKRKGVSMEFSDVHPMMDGTSYSI